VATIVNIAQTANDDDVISCKSRCVKVSRRKNLFRIAVNLDLIGRPEYNNIVVNTEVRIIVIFMLATDANYPSIWQVSSSSSGTALFPENQQAVV